MIEFLAEKINNLVEERDSFKEVFPILKLYPQEKIDNSRFNLINEITISKLKISFVDGGLSEILDSPGLKLVAIRICRIDYNPKKTILLKDFFALINYAKEKYYVNVYQNKKLVLQFSSSEKEKEIISLTRRVLELKIATLAKTEIVVLDGDITCKTEIEKKIIDGKNKKPLICGFAKTNSIVCNNGRSLSLELKKRNGKEWYYKVSENNYNTLYFLKLHFKSIPYKFEFPKFEDSIQPKVTDNINQNLLNQLFCFLKKDSKNPVFLGYPDSLIEVDKLARISKEETKMFKSLLNFYKNKVENEIMEESKVSKAHEILDNMSF